MENIRLENVVLVRWIAALFVMTGHIYCLLQQVPPVVMWNAIQSLGIKIFFVLGGFLITGSWAREQNVKNYAIKRITRIFPPLFLFVIVAAVFVGPLLSTLSLKEYYNNSVFYRYFLNAVLYINYSLPGVFEYNPYPVAVNGSLWSLPVEVFMYILVPIFYYINKKNKNIGIGIVLGVCILCAIKKAFFPGWYYVIYGTDLASMLEVIPFYFMGMLIYVLVEAKSNVKFFKIEIAVLCAAFGFICPGSNDLVMLFLSLLFIPYAVIGVAGSKPNAFTRFLLKHEITYGIFLYGFFIQQCVIYFVYKNGWTLSLSIIEIISILITIIVSELSYRFIEKPIIKWSKKIIKRGAS